jgi:uncharacterized membrane protein YbhN (UPF0104 family)
VDVKDPEATSGSTVSPSVKPRYVVLLILGFIGIYFALPQIGALKDALTVIKHSNWGWVVAGLVLTGLTFPAGTFTQFIAGGKLGSVSELGLLQLAGAFLSHFVPFSLGTIGITARYYQKLGKEPVQATTAATLPTVFGTATTVLMVAFISPPTIRHLTQRFQADSHKHWLIVIVSLTLLLSLLATPWIRRKVHQLIEGVKSGIGSINSPSQVIYMLIGSVALTFFSACTLFASIEAVHARVALTDIFALYVTSSLVSAIAPTPGGIGATEAFLLLGLSSIGIGLPQAAAAVLVYRLLSFWIPMIPGGFALHIINKRPE